MASNFRPRATAELCLLGFIVAPTVCVAQTASPLFWPGVQLPRKW